MIVTPPLAKFGTSASAAAISGVPRAASNRDDHLLSVRHGSRQIDELEVSLRLRSAGRSDRVVDPASIGEAIEATRTANGPALGLGGYQTIRLQDFEVLANCHAADAHLAAELLYREVTLPSQQPNDLLL